MGTRNSQSAGFIRDDFDRGEVITGLLWLSIGALISLLLEVIYLTAWLPIPGGEKVPFPITIIIAWWFNSVLTKTALLWDSRPSVALIPAYVWIIGYFGLMFGVAFTGDQMMANNIRSILLLFAGIVGAVWPFLRR